MSPETNFVTLWDELKQRKIFDFTNKEARKHLFPDLIIKANDGTLLYYHRVLFVSSPFKVLANSLKDGKDSNDNELPLPEDGITCNIILNAMHATGWILNPCCWYSLRKIIRTWDDMMRLVRVCHKYDAEDLKDIILDMRHTGPWPIAELEKLYQECKIKRDLAEQWLCHIHDYNTSQIKSITASPKFWKACENVSITSDRENNILELLLSYGSVSDDYINKVSDYIMKRPYLGYIKVTLTTLLKLKTVPDNILKLVKLLNQKMELRSNMKTDDKTSFGAFFTASCN